MKKSGWFALLIVIIICVIAFVLYTNHEKGKEKSKGNDTSNETKTVLQEDSNLTTYNSVRYSIDYKVPKSWKSMEDAESNGVPGYFVLSGENEEPANFYTLVNLTQKDKYQFTKEKIKSTLKTEGIQDEITFIEEPKQFKVGKYTTNEFAVKAGNQFIYTATIKKNDRRTYEFYLHSPSDKYLEDAKKVVRSVTLHNEKMEEAFKNQTVVDIKEIKKVEEKANAEKDAHSK